ncbi:hypothetical protein E6P72_03450 [Moraxella osloensis]|nr:formyltransferase family protein [Moraxella osloensis]MDI4480149.1 hypothetical protein [Moraxella osloensis]
MKYGFAGDRQISVNILKFLMSKGYEPNFLIVAEGKNASHSQELINISKLNEEHIFTNESIKEPKRLSELMKFDVDYIFGIHFPYIIKNELINLPKVGFLNLHPAYLPFNKGWHTPSWAILDESKYGATLHFMSEELDGGDIIAQEELEVSSTVTANELYRRALKLEEELFYKNLESLLTLNPIRNKQVTSGTSHNKKDLQKIQNINISEKTYPLELLKKLRALTTNNPNEAAYIIIDGKKIGINVKLFEM